MIYLVLLITIVAIASIVTDCMMFKRIKKLILLDKRQQTYISDLINYNTKIIILQKLFFCVQLIKDPQTKQLGVEKLKRNFQLPDQFEITDKNLILQFQKLLKTKQFSFMVKDGKYVIKK